MSVFHIILPVQVQNMRMDQALANQLPQFSRSMIQKLIASQAICVDGLPIEADDRCVGNEHVYIDHNDESNLVDLPQEIFVDTVYEDDDLWVINKPKGLTVHPGNGQRDCTLLNALLFHRPALAQLPRAGIVHRLDKDTSGLMVVAKNRQSRLAVMQMLEQRKMGREYLALVKGAVFEDGVIDAPIMRHPVHRTQMTVARKVELATLKNAGRNHHVTSTAQGRTAKTYYKVVRHYPHDPLQYTLLHCRLATGRTHQIRVHLQHSGYPIVGDRKYRGGADPLQLDNMITRQALHAFYLNLSHPVTHRSLHWQIPLPEDFQKIITYLQTKR